MQRIKHPLYGQATQPTTAANIALDRNHSFNSPQITSTSGVCSEEDLDLDLGNSDAQSHHSISNRGLTNRSPMEMPVLTPPLRSRASPTQNTQTAAHSAVSAAAAATRLSDSQKSNDISNFNIINTMNNNTNTNPISSKYRSSERGSERGQALSEKDALSVTTRSRYSMASRKNSDQTTASSATNETPPPVPTRKFSGNIPDPSGFKPRASIFTRDLPAARDLQRLSREEQAKEKRRELESPSPSPRPSSNGLNRVGGSFENNTASNFDKINTTQPRDRDSFNGCFADGEGGRMQHIRRVSPEPESEGQPNPFKSMQRTKAASTAQHDLNRMSLEKRMEKDAFNKNNSSSEYQSQSQIKNNGPSSNISSMNNNNNMNNNSATGNNSNSMRSAEIGRNGSKICHLYL